MRNLIIIAALVTGMAASAQARPSLRDVPQIENGLFVISVADKIRRECGSISARKLKAYGQLRGLYRNAHDLGYSDDEIEIYVKSDAEKARMTAKRDAYLAAQGVVQTDAATYCTAGHAEIAKSSQIGGLLRAN